MGRVCLRECGFCFSLNSNHSSAAISFYHGQKSQQIFTSKVDDLLKYVDLATPGGAPYSYGLDLVSGRMGI